MGQEVRTNCASEIFVASVSEIGTLHIGHFQGDATLAAYVVAMHNSTL